MVGCRGDVIEITIEGPGDMARRAKLKAVGEMIAESLENLVCDEHGRRVQRVIVKSNVGRPGVRVELSVCCAAMKRAADNALSGGERH